MDLIKQSSVGSIHFDDRNTGKHYLESLGRTFTDLPALFLGLLFPYYL